MATVDAILQAAAYILVRHGWAGFTTNRVAERAGVNIASLYQYFPNKEALVVELQRRHVAKSRVGMKGAVDVLRAQPSLPVMLRLVVEAAVAEHRVAPELHRVFTEELPRSARAIPEVSDAEVERFWMRALEPFAREVPDLALAAFVLRVTMHAVIHEAACARPELLDRPEFIDDVVVLLDRYLRREPATRSRGGTRRPKTRTAREPDVLAGRPSTSG
ncbi:TetR/AcrR family transcriptional regulator [Myxococcus stipitatus]|uniref:TetR/AcrR family transcriptional regulator n=1 Tax=Myxococcus stipitatus TaxID=83455 RepID=UPI001F3F43FF|nr:TetR/AcrR family transcriptional regulator [Myxococcus stipitatus]MCE9668828.1 TetR/AcrR family transcriptional regulator [Myxococcus stipitatus]